MNAIIIYFNDRFVFEFKFSLKYYKCKTHITSLFLSIKIKNVYNIFLGNIMSGNKIDLFKNI